MFDGFKERRISSFDNHRLYYAHNFERADTNLPTLVWHYGLVCSNWHFEYQLPFFMEHKFPMIIHDYRGHFESSSQFPLNSVTFANIARDVISIMDDINLGQAVHIGHSMGVNVCLEIARTFPEQCQANVLISGNVLPVSEIMFDTNIMAIFIPKIKNLLEKIPGVTQKVWSTLHKNPLALAIVKQGGFNTDHVSDAFIIKYLEQIGKLPHQMFFQLFEQMTVHDVSMDLKNILSPTLIIGGDSDKIIPNYLQSFLNDQLPNSKVYYLRKGSHVPQADFPALINQRILHYLNKEIISNRHQAPGNQPVF